MWPGFGASAPPGQSGGKAAAPGTNAQCKSSGPPPAVKAGARNADILT